jgi:hypothetical protein
LGIFFKLNLSFNRFVKNIANFGGFLSAAWQIDLIDCMRSLVKVSHLGSNQTKSFFVSRLKEASIDGTNLVAVCEDAVWIVDILSGNRKRMDKRSLISSSKINNVEVYIPEFLKKDRS